MKKLQWTAILLLFCLLLPSCQAKPQVLLEIRMLDVGQGDAFLLTTREGEHILIDAGPIAKKELLCRRLSELGVERIKLAVFTHPDEDHIGGAALVLERFTVEKVWTNGQDSGELFYGDLLEVIQRRGVSHHAVSTGDSVQLGDTILTVLAPAMGLTGDSNADSLVLKVRCGDVSALFMGDADTGTESELVRLWGEELDADILKVGHHGSFTSTGGDFLQVVTPSYALISADRGSAHGHPGGGVLRRLEEVGARILRTDLLGEVCLTTDGKQVYYH